MPHIFGRHICSAAGPIARSEVSFLLACTSKTTHKRHGPITRTNLGLTSTGLTSTPLLVPLPGPKCRFCWPAQAKPHTSGVVPLPVPHIYGPHIYGPHICGRTHSNTHTHIHIHTHIHTLIHIHIHIQRVLSAAGPIARSEVSFLLACTSKTTHNGSDPKARTNLPAPAPRPAAPAPYRLRQTGVIWKIQSAFERSRRALAIPGPPGPRGGAEQDDPDLADFARSAGSQVVFVLWSRSNPFGVLRKRI